MKHEEVAKRLLSLLQKHGINQQTQAKKILKAFSNKKKTPPKR